MSEKKGLFGGLFGSKKSNCCNIKIVEETGCDCGGACDSTAEQENKSSNTAEDKSEA